MMPPYYESRFIRANHPDRARAVWLRWTLLYPQPGDPVADVWVMDPAVVAVDQTMNLPASALNRGGTQTVMVQRYLPEIVKGDKRILVIGGAGSIGARVVAEIADGSTKPAGT